MFSVQAGCRTRGTHEMIKYVIIFLGERAGRNILWSQSTGRSLYCNDNY